MALAYAGGLALKMGTLPTVIVTARTPPLLGTNTSLCLSSIVKTPATALPAAAKTLSYLNSALAFHEAQKKGYGEAVLLDVDGNLAECASSSLFFVQKGILHTPSLSLGILPGIVRARVIALARGVGFRIKEGRFKPVALLRADEVFITNSSKEIVPVERFGKTKIGGGHPGPLTLHLGKLYREMVERYASKAASRSERRV